mmetsp:Transcript_135774/g.378362  ORF Transcript_135774/g.378362 Transcript_135774/m.378362 type:complete len:347 (-) Transcript_135774:4-1044(-)
MSVPTDEGALVRTHAGHGKVLGRDEGRLGHRAHGRREVRDVLQQMPQQELEGPGAKPGGGGVLLQVCATLAGVLRHAPSANAVTCGNADGAGKHGGEDKRLAATHKGCIDEEGDEVRPAPEVEVPPVVDGAVCRGCQYARAAYGEATLIGKLPPQERFHRDVGVVKSLYDAAHFGQQLLILFRVSDRPEKVQLWALGQPRAEEHRQPCIPLRLVELLPPLFRRQVKVDDHGRHSLCTLGDLLCLLDGGLRCRQGRGGRKAHRLPAQAEGVLQKVDLQQGPLILLQITCGGHGCHDHEEAPGCTGKGGAARHGRTEALLGTHKKQEELASVPDGSPGAGQSLGSNRP